MDDDDDRQVQFQSYHVSRSSLEEKSKLVEWVIKHSMGLIKDEKQATKALLGFVIVVVIISLFLFFGGSGGGVKPLPYEKTYKPSLQF